MSRKIAVIASSIHLIRQKHLIEWFEDLRLENSFSRLFLGSRNKEIVYAHNYRINFKKEKMKYALVNFFRFYKRSKELKEISPLIDFEPQVIHLLTSNAFETIEPLLSITTIKLIVSFRGFDINVFPNQSEGNKLLLRRIFEKADVLHFISENLKDTAVKLGAAPSKCKVIYRSIRFNQQLSLARTSYTKKKLKILTVARLVWEKGYLYALKTMAILQNKGFDFEYHIVGTGIDLNMLIYHVNRLGIQDRIIFHGELPRTEVKRKLMSADIYFQPSLSEALSLSIIEASFYGLPIVSSNIGGIPEVVMNKISGFLSKPCESSIYADNIIKLYKDPTLRTQMGNNGHKLIIESFSRDKEIEKWIELYANI